MANWYEQTFTFDCTSHAAHGNHSCQGSDMIDTIDRLAVVCTCVYVVRARSSCVTHGNKRNRDLHSRHVQREKNIQR